MKIERINDNQIRCMLTREDLELRQIKLSELAYGSEKARDLFQDMIQQANYELGFEVDDIPLMVEAIPMPAESIMLLVTKVEYPEELDTRFSKFTETDDDEYPEYMHEEEPEIPNGADDILDIFEKIRKQKEALYKDQKSTNPTKAAIEEAAHKVRPEVVTDLVKMFEFRRFDQVERLSHVLSGFYKGENALYKDKKNQRYELLMHKSSHTPVEFNKICNIASEYANQRNYTPSMKAYFEEHGCTLVGEKALQVIHTL